jgi:hypothetical protein
MLHAIMNWTKCIAQFWINQNPPLPFRVDWPMSKHLSAQGRPDLRGELYLLILMSKQNLNPFSWHIWHINNCWKWIRNEKVMTPPKVKGVKNSKKQTTKHYQSHSQTPKKFLVCRFVAIRVQEWFCRISGGAPISL